MTSIHRCIRCQIEHGAKSLMLLQGEDCSSSLGSIRWKRKCGRDPHIERGGCERAGQVRTFTRVTGDGGGGGDDGESNGAKHDHQSHACFFRYGNSPFRYTSNPKIIALLEAAGGV